MRITIQNMARSNRLIVLTGLVILLSSCAGLERSQLDTEALDSSAQRAQINNLQHWKILGKLGIRTPDKAISATVNWTQTDNYFDIFLSGPLGQGSTRIEGSDGDVSLHTNDQRPLRAASPEELLYQTVGWQLPISDLKYWVRGIAAPNHHVDQLERNTDGTISLLAQQGWTITYTRYQIEHQLLLPARLVITRDKIRLTFIIKNWQLTPWIL